MELIIQICHLYWVVSFGQVLKRGLFCGAMLTIPHQHILTVDPNAIRPVDLDMKEVEAGLRYAEQALKSDGVAGAALTAYA